MKHSEVSIDKLLKKVNDAIIGKDRFDYEVYQPREKDGIIFRGKSGSGKTKLVTDILKKMPPRWVMAVLPIDNVKEYNNLEPALSKFIVDNLPTLIKVVKEDEDVKRYMGAKPSFIIIDEIVDEIKKLKPEEIQELVDLIKGKKIILLGETQSGNIVIPGLELEIVDLDFE